MSINLPIIRDTRERDYAADVGQTVFGFDAPLLEGQDLQVFTKTGPDGWWERKTTGFTVAVAEDRRSATVTFTVPPRAASSPTVAVRLRGARVTNRTTDVTRGGVLRAAGLEGEFDGLALVLQELRRDADAFRADLQRLSALVGEVDPTLLLRVLAAAAGAELWAQSDAPIPVSAGGDGVDDRSAKYWAEVAKLFAGGATDEISAEVDYVSITNQRLDPVLSDTALAAGKPYVEDGFAVDDGESVLLVSNVDARENRIVVYNKAANRLDPSPAMAIGSTVTRPFSVRVNGGTDYAGAVFSLVTFGGLIGTTALEWKNEETGAGVTSPNRFYGGAATPVGFPRQAAPRRLVNADMPLLRGTPAITTWEPSRPAITRLKVRQISTVMQELGKWSRTAALQIAFAESPVIEIDEPVYLRTTPALDLRAKTMICHGPACPIIQMNPAASVLDLSSAASFTIEGHLHIRYPFRSSAKALTLGAPDRCGRLRADVITTEGVDTAVSLLGTLTDRVYFAEIGVANYGTDTPILVAQTLDKIDVPRLAGKPIAGSQAIDAAKTYVWGQDPQVLSLTGAMTAGRVLTLSAQNAFEGARARIIHAASGGYGWTINDPAGTPILTVTNGADPDFVATGGTWILW